MHKVYENDDVAMYFKKRYCYCCGNTLDRKRTERVVTKNDPDYKSYCSIGITYKPHGDILVVGRSYYCPNCQRTFTCDEQSDVINAQKAYGRKIVSEQEIATTRERRAKSLREKRIRLKWWLLIPVIGGIVCLYLLYSDKSHFEFKGISAKVPLLCIIVFVAVAALMRLISYLIMLYHQSLFLEQYQNILALIVALLSFNVPVYWLIHFANIDK